MTRLINILIKIKLIFVSLFQQKSIHFTIILTYIYKQIKFLIDFLFSLNNEKKVHQEIRPLFGNIPVI